MDLVNFDSSHLQNRIADFDNTLRVQPRPNYPLSLIQQLTSEARRHSLCYIRSPAVCAASELQSCVLVAG